MARGGGNHYAKYYTTTLFTKFSQACSFLLITPIFLRPTTGSTGGRLAGYCKKKMLCEGDELRGGIVKTYGGVIELVLVSGVSHHGFLGNTNITTLTITTTNILANYSGKSTPIVPRIAGRIGIVFVYGNTATNGSNSIIIGGSTGAILISRVGTRRVPRNCAIRDANRLGVRRVSNGRYILIALGGVSANGGIAITFCSSIGGTVLDAAVAVAITSSARFICGASLGRTLPNCRVVSGNGGRVDGGGHIIVRIGPIGPTRRGRIAICCCRRNVRRGSTGYVNVTAVGISGAIAFLCTGRLPGIDGRI